MSPPPRGPTIKIKPLTSNSNVAASNTLEVPTGTRSKSASQQPAASKEATHTLSAGLDEVR